MHADKDIRIRIESNHLWVVLCEGKIGDVDVALLGNLEKGISLWGAYV
jgi:hypothetical protein